MRIGIGALLYNLDEALDICGEIREINHIELGIDNLEECEEILKYKNKFDELGLSIGIHLPMELNTCENINYIRYAWSDFIGKISAKLENFDIKYFNMHLGYVMTNRLQKKREKYLDNSVIFLNSIKTCRDIELTIENTYANKGDYSNIGNDVYDFEYIFNRVDNIKFCYDTGHDLINSSDYINKMEDKITVVHLSDNNGIEDLHNGIGMGILSYDKIKQVIHLNPKYLVLEMGYEYIEESLKKIEIIKRGV